MPQGYLGVPVGLDVKLGLKGAIPPTNFYNLLVYCYSKRKVILIMETNPFPKIDLFPKLTKIAHWLTDRLVCPPMGAGTESPFDQALMQEDISGAGCADEVEEW